MSPKVKVEKQKASRKKILSGGKKAKDMMTDLERSTTETSDTTIFSLQKEKFAKTNTRDEAEYEKRAWKIERAFLLFMSIFALVVIAPAIWAIYF